MEMFLLSVKAYSFSVFFAYFLKKYAKNTLKKYAKNTLDRKGLSGGAKIPNIAR